MKGREIKACRHKSLTANLTPFPYSEAIIRIRLAYNTAPNQAWHTPPDSRWRSARRILKMYKYRRTGLWLGG